MIPPQLLAFAAKHGRKLLVALAALIVVAGVYFAVQAHERTVDRLAASEAARAAQATAHNVTLGSLQNQKQAAAMWQASAKKFQDTLSKQERVSVSAREEGGKIDKALRDNRLARLARSKPVLTERAINRATARIIGLLNCASTPGGCDGDPRTARPDAPDSVPAPADSGDIRVDGDGPWILARRGQSLFLSRPIRVRSSGT